MKDEMFDCHAHYGIPTDDALVCSASPDEPANKKAFPYRSIGWIPEGGSSSIKALESQLEDHTFLGEIGIDRRFPNKDEQFAIFQKCLHLATERNTLVTIHYVGYTDLLFRALKESKTKRFIIHGFTGSYETAKAFQELGGMVSISERYLTTKNPLPLIQSKSFLTETDLVTGPEQKAKLLSFNTKLSEMLDDDIGKRVRKLFFDYISGIFLPI